MSPTDPLRAMNEDLRRTSAILRDRNLVLLAAVEYYAQGGPSDGGAYARIKLDEANNYPSIGRTNERREALEWAAAQIYADGNPELARQRILMEAHGITEADVHESTAALREAQMRAIHD